VARGPLGAHPRHTRLHWTRREILRGLAATAVVASIPWARRAHALLPLELLHAPIGLSSGQTHRGHRYLVADDFDSNAFTNGITGGAVNIGSSTGAVSGAVLEDVIIYGARQWASRWNTQVEVRPYALGVSSGHAGIIIRNAPSVRVERVHVAGFPQAAIHGWGIPNGVIRDFSAADCFNAMILKTNDGNAPSNFLSPGALFERCSMRNTWGPGPGRWVGVGGGNSAIRYKGFTGGTAFGLSGISDSIIRNCSVRGEAFGSYKLSVCDNLLVEFCEGGFSQIASFATNVLVRDCVFSRRLAYFTTGAAPFQNGLEVTNENAVGDPPSDVEVERCKFINLKTEPPGDAINLGTENQTADVHDCYFEGWNGWQGRASYAIASAEGNSFNADFDSGAGNVFYNQDNLSLQLGAPPPPPGDDCTFPFTFPCDFEGV
jgi:hypothetical protein